MLVYLSIFIILSSLSILVRDHTYKHVWLCFIFLFLLIFAGFRFEVGCDFWGYLQRYNNLDPYLSMADSFTFTEPLFQAIMIFVKNSGFDYVWLNVICTLLFILFMSKFLVKSPEPLFYFTLLFPILILQLGMSGLRQALAVACLMSAMSAFININRYGVAFWIFIGSLFHESVLIFLPLAFVCGREVNVKKLILALIVVGPLAALLLADRMDVYNDRYVAQIYGSNSSSGGLIRLVLMLIPAILFQIWKVNYKALYPKLFPVMQLFSLITFALIPVALVSTVAVHRLGYFIYPFSMFHFALFPLVYKSGRSQLNMSLAIFGLLAIYMFTWFTISKHASACYVPYDSYLFGVI